MLCSKIHYISTTLNYSGIRQSGHFGILGSGDLRIQGSWELVDTGILGSGDMGIRGSKDEKPFKEFFQLEKLET